jgi:NhaA family Na+:H+ antiporter
VSTSSPGSKRKVFGALRSDEETFLGRLLRQETVGGGVVLAAAVVAVLWANSPWADAYDAVRHYKLGPLDIQHWAADGALTLFFYLAGVELKREFVVGSLRRPADAAVPVVAAIAGVLVPSAIYVTLNAGVVPGLADGSLKGWAIPSATDIAFALAVLAVVGRSLPSPLRAFLLTLAVVDDLIVIIIIAAFYTSSVNLLWLLAAVAGLGVFALLQWYRGESWLWYLPLSLAIWWCTHESGIHATIAGVALLAGVGFTVALLVADLSFGGPEGEAAKTAVLLGSVVAAGLAATILGKRSRTYAAKQSQEA